MASPTRRLALLVALGLTLSIAASADPPAKPTRSVVPFEVLATNHMVVQAKVNGKGPFRLVFDLGAPVTLLSTKAGEASGLVKKNSPRSIFTTMRQGAAIETLEFGDLKAEGVPAVVLDHPVMRALGSILGRPLDGIVGFTLFARYKTTIDYQALQMTFEPVDFQARDVMRDMAGRLAGPKIARKRVLAPASLFGLVVAEPESSSAGVPVREVRPHSPAEAAGLKPGDVLNTLDGRWTTSVSDAFAAASTTPPGQPVEAVVLREGRELTLKVTPLDGL